MIEGLRAGPKSIHIVLKNSMEEVVIPNYNYMII